MSDDKVKESKYINPLFLCHHLLHKRAEVALHFLTHQRNNIYIFFEDKGFSKIVSPVLSWNLLSVGELGLRSGVALSDSEKVFDLISPENNAWAFRYDNKSIRKQLFDTEIKCINKKLYSSLSLS